MRTNANVSPARIRPVEDSSRRILRTALSNHSRGGVMNQAARLSSRAFALLIGVGCSLITTFTPMTTHAAPLLMAAAPAASTATPQTGETGPMQAQAVVRPATLTSTVAAPTFLPDQATATSCTFTVLPNDNSTSGNERCPMLRNRFGRSIYLITAAELAANGLVSGSAITGIGWNYQTAQGVSAATPLIVYLQNTADVTNTKSTTWATAITGM